jgi:hypothetical protein
MPKLKPGITTLAEPTAEDRLAAVCARMQARIDALDTQLAALGPASEAREAQLRGKLEQLEHDREWGGPEVDRAVVDCLLSLSRLPDELKADQLRISTDRERIAALLAAAPTNFERLQAAAEEAKAARVKVLQAAPGVIAAEAAARALIDEAKKASAAATAEAEKLFTEVRELAATLGEPVPAPAARNAWVIASAAYHVALHAAQVADHAQRTKALAPRPGSSEEFALTTEREGIEKYHHDVMLQLFDLGNVDYSLGTQYPRAAQLQDLQIDPERYIARVNAIKERDAKARAEGIRMYERDTIRAQLEQEAGRMGLDPNDKSALRRAADQCGLASRAQEYGVIGASR